MLLNVCVCDSVKTLDEKVMEGKNRTFMSKQADSIPSSGELKYEIKHL